MYLVTIYYIILFILFILFILYRVFNKILTYLSEWAYNLIFLT